MEGEVDNKLSPAEVLKAAIFNRIPPNSPPPRNTFGVDVETYHVVNFLKPQLSEYRRLEQGRISNPGTVRILEDHFNNMAREWGFSSRGDLGIAMYELKDTLKAKMTEKQWNEHFGHL